MSDLKDCGALEQDTDIIAQLWYDEDQDEALNFEKVKLCINKNRNGPTGDIKMKFYKQFTRFEELEFMSDYTNYETQDTNTDTVQLQTSITI